MFPFFLAAVLTCTRPSGGTASKPDFGRAVPWNAGAAEVTTYETTGVKSGIPRTSRAALIVVALLWRGATR